MKPAVQKPRAALRKIVFRGVISENPVLVRSLALAPVLAATTTLKNGLLLSADTFLLLVVMGAVSSLMMKRLPAYLSPAAVALLSAAAVTPICAVSYQFTPNVTESVGIFLPLIAVNGIIISEARGFDSHNSALLSALDGAANGLGYALVIIALSAAREILSRGRLFDCALPFLRGLSFNFALLPPGAFLTMAFVSAGLQFIRKRTRK